MASPHRQRQRNNTIAGAFVLIALLAFIVVVLTLSNLGSVFGGTKLVEARFPLTVGVPGLERGADVAVGMRPVGAVTDVRPVLASPASGMGGEDGARGSYISVILRVPSDVEITDQTRAELVVPLLGSGSFINLGGVGEGAPLSKVAAGPGRDDVLSVPGLFAPSIILQQAGITARELESVRNFVRRLDTISARVESITSYLDGTLQEDGPEIVSNLRDTVTRAQALVRDIESNRAAWVARVNSILENVEETSARGPQLAERADALLANADAGISDVRGIVQEVSPNIRNTALNVEDITSRVRHETLNEVSRLLDRGETTLAQAAEIAAQVDATLTTELPQLSRVLGNMRIASDNLKLAMIEIRAEPWRVLYEPTSEEVQESLTNDIVRTYANAVSDLNAAVVSLKALHDRYGANLEPEDEAVQRVLNELESSLETYQEREAQWFQQIIGENGRP